MIDSEKIICCEPLQPTNEEEKAFFEALEKLSDSTKIDISIISYVVKLKDRVIKELQEKISLLNSQIKLLKQTNTAKSISSVEQKIEEKVNPTKTTLTVDKESGGSKKQINNMQTDYKKTVDKKAVSLGIMQTETEVRLNKYININNDPQTQSTSRRADDWQMIEKKRRNRRQTIIESNKGNKIVQGVPKEAVLHVYRVDKDTTDDSLTKLVKQHFPEVTAESITPKYPHLYASFKVTISEENFEKAMNS